MNNQTRVTVNTRPPAYHNQRYDNYRNSDNGANGADNFNNGANRRFQNVAPAFSTQGRNIDAYAVWCEVFKKTDCDNVKRYHRECKETNLNKKDLIDCINKRINDHMIKKKRALRTPVCEKICKDKMDPTICMAECMALPNSNRGGSSMKKKKKKPKATATTKKKPKATTATKKTKKK